MPTFYEFFSGGGMVRAGLGPRWQCLFANDLDEKKASSYRDNWGGGELLVKDVVEVVASDLPGNADLVWASFPCQDLSLAGVGAGLSGERSGTFWPFWKLVKGLDKEGRAPKIIALENVCGALTSHRGKDFSAICSALSGGGYRFGAIVANAADFLPQSRPRLFIIAVHRSLKIPSELIGCGGVSPWHSLSLVKAVGNISLRAQNSWVWWSLPMPPGTAKKLSDVIEDDPTGIDWHTKEQTDRLLGMMTSVNLEKVKAAQSSRVKRVGSIYRRTRDGVQRAEVRFDDVAGCLRTPSGGSSRQTILVVDGDFVRSRLLSAREAARLMGLSDDYILPVRYNDAYKLAGDGVAVPVVSFISQKIFEPLLSYNRRELVA